MKAAAAGIAVCLTLVTLQISAQNTSPTTGSISGRILDADTNEPVVGAKVGSRQTGFAITDSSGRYELKDLMPGPASVWVVEENGGYLSMSLNSPRAVTVAAGTVPTNVDFRVRLDARISGRVLDENGSPIPGMRVAIVSGEYSRDRGVNNEREYSIGEVLYLQGARAVTDDQGRYSIVDGIMAGRKYWVLTYDSKTTVAAIADAPQDPQSRKDIRIPTYFPSASSRDAAAPVVLHSMEHRDNVDIRVSKAHSYCVEGITSMNGVPSSLRFNLVEENVAMPPPTVMGTSGTDGRIRVCGLYPGHYQLTAATALRRDDLSDYSGSTPFTITDSDVRGVNVSAEPLLTIPGSVVWDGAAPNAASPASIGIAMTPLSGRPISWNSPNVPGNFSLQALPNTHLSLQIRLPANTYVKDISYGGSSILHKSFVPVGGGGELKVSVGRDGGLLRVTAANSNGQPSPQTTVIVYPSNATDETAIVTGMTAGRTNDAGVYTGPPLSPGKYIVLATNDPPPGVINLPQGSFYLERTPDTLGLLLRARSRGQEVDVASGVTVDIRLAPKPLN